MRIGQNPLKTEEVRISPPAPVTIGVLNYIPDQVGYFKNQLDVLRLCVRSIRANADREVDILVVDNGSCEAVVDHLRAELAAGVVDHLILNRRNIGKGNAMMQILRSALGDYIFYTDGDIFFKEGWVSAHIEILKAFPAVGVVGGIPLRNHADSKYAQRARSWIADNFDGQVEIGDLIPEEWTVEFLRSLGVSSPKLEAQLSELNQLQDCRLTHNERTAFLGASHMQFLISRETIEKIPNYRFGYALHTEDDDLVDHSIDTLGLLRLSTAHPMVYHMGNKLTEGWLTEEYNRLVGPTQRLMPSKVGVRRHWFWGRGRVRKIVKGSYQWLFDKYYRDELT